MILWATADGPANLLFAQQAKGPEYKAKKKAAQAITHPIPAAGTKVDAAQLAKIIDDEITMRLKQEKLHASPKADDYEFIRRATLDITGVIPTTERVKAFVESKDPDKRVKLVDQLLQEPGFGKQLAEIWTTEIITSDPDNKGLPAQQLRSWLQDSFNKNKPWSKIVSELVTASGDWEENPTTLFFIANNSADKMTGQVSRLFLGVQLQCAQCHNHPFTDWKQDEYWAMAAFFTRVKQNGTPKQVQKNGGTITITEAAAAPGAGKLGKKKGNNLPEGYKVVPAKFLAGDRATITGSARGTLTKWMTSETNPFFAKAMVNKMWAHFFGRGFVNPIDDMHDDNPATHLELLLAMSEQFRRNDFDLKYLVKAIVLSDAYQRTSKPFQGNEADTELFSRMYIKTMSPEQLFDSITVVTGGAGKDAFGKKGAGPVAGGKKGGGGGPRDQFIRFFRVDEGADPLEYQDGIPHALRLMNSPLLNNGGKTLDDAARKSTPADALNHLFMVALSRPPTAQETQRLTAFVAKQSTPRTAYTDILWTLLNSSEFRLNH